MTKSIDSKEIFSSTDEAIAIAIANEAIKEKEALYGSALPLENAKEYLAKKDANALVKQTNLGFFKDPKYADVRRALYVVAAALVISAILAVVIALAIFSSGTALVPVLPILGVGLKGAGVAAVAAAGHSASAALATAALTKGSVSLFALTAPKITGASIIAYVLIGLSALAVAIGCCAKCCKEPRGMRLDD